MLTASAMTTVGALPVFLLTAQVAFVSADLHFGAARLGLAASIFFAAAAVSSFGTGVLAERLGGRISTVASATLSVVSCLGIAFFASSYGQLVAWVIVGGVANAALQTTSNLSLAHSIPASSQGLAFGMKQSAIPAAILIGGLAVPTVGHELGWRAPFMIAAFLAVITAGVGLRLTPARSSASTARPAAREAPPTGALILTTVTMALASSAVNSLGAFLPAWCHENGWEPGRAGLLVAAASATSIAGRVLAGIAADRRRGRNLPVVSVHLIAGAVGIALISTGAPAPLIVGAFLAFGLGWSWPGLLLFAVVRVARDSPGRASGAIQTGAFIGGAVGPLTFGLLVEARGYDTAWWAAVVGLIVAASLLFLARRIFVTDLIRRPMTH
ncbi:MFS transporter [Aeromicrobium duanguangcaii]|uniref:MFS transporter n=1 Tax=Aeromicrobium duanguangcaii TaxID=2968086 RepID=A0ABY5KE21_9ACTN|nr:MFS transporter [Aeromicrobium duanguangcaii]MCD9155067.1 MFS transporter [Aeromicrobium duanguangcaii]UUI68278.1 MFS transporter [Aeromicrobium duanguangcaii]